MRILVFGDSIAYGEYDGQQGGWATRLYLEYLNRRANDLAGDHPFIFNLSIGSETTHGVVNRLAQETEARRYANEEFAFVFAIGINDSRRDKNTGEYVSSPEQYGKDLQELFTIAQKYASKILFVGLTPVEDEQFANNKRFESSRIWEFEQVLRQFTTEKNLPFIPLLEEFRQRIETGEKLFVDGLHPNDAGHQLMLEKIKPPLDALTKEVDFDASLNM